MSNEYHDPIPVKSPANAATFNGPLGQLDQALVELIARAIQQVQLAGAAQTGATKLNFTGEGVSGSYDPVTNTLSVNIPGAAGVGSAHVIQLDGVSLANRSRLNFLSTDGLSVVDNSANDSSDVKLFLPGSKNPLINGSFAVWQRQVPGTATERADDTYGPDRWVVLTQSNPIDVKRIDGNSQRYAVQLIQKNVTMQRLGLAQILEGVNCRHLRGKEVTLSFRGRLSAAGTLRFAVLEWTGTEDVVTSDVVAAWAGDITSWATNITAQKGSQALDANTWTDCKLTVTLGSTFTNLIVFVWTDSQLAQNATLDLEAVQLVQGKAALPFFENVADELISCLRYFESSYNSDKAPGTSGALGHIIDTIASSNKSYVPVFGYAAPKRITPTITFYSLSGGLAGKISEYNVGGSLVQNLDGNSAAAEKNCFYYISGGTPTIGNTFRFHFTADAEL